LTHYLLLDKEYMFLVYKVTFPNNKAYIGITSRTLKKRKIEHYSKSKRFKFYFYNALNKYKGKEKWETIYTTSKYENLLEKEKHFINKFRTFDKKFGYNLTLGGEGTLGRITSAKTRKLLSKIGKGRIVSKETREKLSKIKKGIKFGKDFGTKVALGHKVKPFIVLEKNTNKFIGEWVNRKHCADSLKLSRRKIQDCLQGKRKSTGEYLFIFKEVYHRKTLK
jgi:hypothetical protein